MDSLRNLSSAPVKFVRANTTIMMILILVLLFYLYSVINKAFLKFCEIKMKERNLNKFIESLEQEDALKKKDLENLKLKLESSIVNNDYASFPRSEVEAKNFYSQNLSSIKGMTKAIFRDNLMHLINGEQIQLRVPFIIGTFLFPLCAKIHTMTSNIFSRILFKEIK